MVLLKLSQVYSMLCFAIVLFNQKHITLNQVICFWFNAFTVPILLNQAGAFQHFFFLLSGKPS